MSTANACAVLVAWSRVDRIDIGPFQLTFDRTALTKEGRIGNVELRVRDVSYDVSRRRARGVPTRILHGANLRILPSEFVAIIGANDSGKSTLMNIMAGRVHPTEGAVLVNGGDLHANFQALKQDIAFVPQQDVLHEQLTVRQALTYRHGQQARCAGAGPAPSTHNRGPSCRRYGLHAAWLADRADHTALLIGGLSVPAAALARVDKLMRAQSRVSAIIEEIVVIGVGSGDQGPYARITPSVAAQ
jgi:ABC-type dipeptide/oligopeptide/nickel transport system ATPase component